MGEVWAALNELTNREFAIKFLLPEFARNQEAFDRFVREAKTTGTLRHPHIVDVYDVAMGQDNTPFIVMELLHGEEMESLVEREGALSPLKTAAYFAQIASALQAAHDAGVIHRDLSTNNIFLCRSKDGAITPKILDFGVSKTLGPDYDGQSVTQSGAVLGNPIFMSPEQARGAGSVDARTDVWSMGVSMYQALTGKLPFRNTNYNALMVDIMSSPHRPLLELLPQLDRELAEVIELCLQKDRDRRMRSAEQLCLRLTDIARRLSTDPKELGRTPRRRATDRLPALVRAEHRESMAKAGVSLPRRVVDALGLPAPSRAVVAVFAAALGAGLGVQVGQRMNAPAPVIIAAGQPAFAAPETAASSESGVRSPAAPVADTTLKNKRLKQQVMRGLAQAK